MNTHVIRQIPNAAYAHSAVASLRGPSTGRVRKRGRGPRANRREEQDLPMEKAQRFSLYLEGKPGTWKKEFWDWCGLDSRGKPRVRYAGNNHGE